jgi:hypothetical protein
MFFEREEAKFNPLESGEVTLRAGELAPWSHPTSYQIKEIKVPELDADGRLAPICSEREPDMPLEMARGPPAHDAIPPGDTDVNLSRDKLPLLI